MEKEIKFKDLSPWLRVAVIFVWVKMGILALSLVALFWIFWISI